MKIRIQYVVTAMTWILGFSAVAARHPWLAVFAFSLFILVAFKASKMFNSDLRLTVGLAEKHAVRFVRSQTTGGVSISVDGETPSLTK